VIAFVTIAVLLYVAADVIFLDPLLHQQREMAQKSQQDQQQIAVMQAEIQMRINAQSEDPDKANRLRLEMLRKQSTDIKAELMGMQKGLVSPEKMAALLEDILKRNGKLRLISLKTIPVTPLVETPAADAPAVPTVPAVKAPSGGPADPQSAKAAFGTVYKHAVEMTVQGTYLDMVNYLTLLESMPWQIFWGKAQLDAKDYSKATLTLTLFTLSLDQTWLNI
jgi:MSHA biogenesis protein MshJ